MFDFVEPAIHLFHLLAMLGDFFRIGFGIGGAFGHFDGAVIYVQMLVVADGLKIVGEFGRERVAVVDGVVIAVVLVSAHGVFHFFCRVGEDVELVEIFDGAVDDAGARGGVNFEGDVGEICVRRKRLKAEAGDFSGIGVFHVEITDRFGGAVAFFDEEFDVEAFTFENLDEFEAASHAVERHHALGGVFRVVLVDVGVHLSAIAAVEGGEPCLEGLAGWSGGDGSLR